MNVIPYVVIRVVISAAFILETKVRLSSSLIKDSTYA